MTCWPTYVRSPAHERTLETELVGYPPDATLEGRFVAAICPQCGGWTMFHGEPKRDDVRSEVRDEYVFGNLIVFWRNPLSLGHACMQADKRAEHRTCGYETPEYGEGWHGFP